MKHKTFYYLVFFQLIALALLFPYTPNGQKATGHFFPGGNFGEDILISALEEMPTEDTAVLSPSVSYSDYYRDIRGELPGLYDLISIHTDDDTLSDELISHLHALGVPMMLELHADGSSIFGVFDQAITPEYDADRMLFLSDGNALPFFYLDNMLRIQEGEFHLIFEKR